jgi:hypothetical protein
MAPNVVVSLIFPAVTALGATRNDCLIDGGKRSPDTR